MRHIICVTLLIVSSILYICQSVHVSVFAALLKKVVQHRKEVTLYLFILKLMRAKID